MSRIMMGQWLRWGTRMPSVQRPPPGVGIIVAPKTRGLTTPGLPGRPPPGVVTYRMAKERPSQRVIELSPGSTTPGYQGRMEVRPPA